MHRDMRMSGAFVLAGASAALICYCSAPWPRLSPPSQQPTHNRKLSARSNTCAYNVSLRPHARSCEEQYYILTTKSSIVCRFACGLIERRVTC